MQIINTTPHSIRFQRAVDGEVFEVAPCGVLINAKVTEVTVGKHPCGAELVKVVFTGDEANTAALDNLEAEHPGAVIIGSMGDHRFDGRGSGIPWPGICNDSGRRLRTGNPRFEADAGR